MFITIEGIDGCGKSTQAKKLGRWLQAKTGNKTICTFEPGDYPYGKPLRKLILSGERFGSLAELLLFLADRVEHTGEVIAPALRGGYNVICERWNESTLAYQTGRFKVPMTRAKRLISACKLPKPDVKLFLDVDPKVAYIRVLERRDRTGKIDGFEREGLSLLYRVSEVYRKLAEEGELLRIDCNGLNEDEVFTAITEAIEWRFR